MALAAAQSDNSPRAWNRRVWRLAVPIIASNISVPLLGMVDTAVMGHLPGPQYLGAIAIGAMIFSFLYWGFGFLRMGTTGLTAQAAGAGDGDEVRAVLARALAIAVMAGAVLMAAQSLFGTAAFALIDASAEVEALSQRYFAARIWGAPAALANFVLLGWFLGLQSPASALVLQIAMNGLNIVLDLVFVLMFGWDVVGVAVATALSEYGALCVGFFVVLRLLRRHPGAFLLSRVTEPGAFRRLVALNLDIFVRTVCLLFAFAYFTVQGAKMGDVVLAANAVLMNFLTFSAYALDGFAHAVEALVGRTIGARDKGAFRMAVAASTKFAVMVAFGFAAVYLAAGELLIGILTSVEPVRAVAGDYLPWLVVLPVAAVWAYQLDGIFLGATGGRTMRNAMILSLAFYLAACAVLVPVLGNHGLWLSLTLFMIARGATLGFRYNRLATALDAR